MVIIGPESPYVVCLLISERKGVNDETQTVRPHFRGRIYRSRVDRLGSGTRTRDARPAGGAAGDSSEAQSQYLAAATMGRRDCAKQGGTRCHSRQFPAAQSGDSG